MKSNLLYPVIFLGVIGFYSCSSNSSTSVHDKIHTNNSTTNDSGSNISSETGVTQTQEVPFSKETIDEIKERESKKH